jgi:Domain of unknown function (DUF397)
MQPNDKQPHDTNDPDERSSPAECWRTSSHSNPSGNCVQLGMVLDGGNGQGAAPTPGPGAPDHGGRDASPPDR